MNIIHHSSCQNLSEIASLLGTDCTDSRDIQYLLTDSRSLTFPEATLFFALVTERGNGHTYIPTLYESGVRAFVVSQDIPNDIFPEATFIKVKDTLMALQEVAAHHRAMLSYPILSITGSNGKTTLKELLYQLLSTCHSIGRSPRSYNSQIGVPLSLWSLPATLDLGIIEAGISQIGEMNRLEKIIAPTYGAITNIGEAHQLHFNSLQEKAREKLSLFRHCKLIFAPYDDPIIRETIEEMGLTKNTKFWSRECKDATLFVESTTDDVNGTTITLLLDGEKKELRLPFLDKGSIDDCLLALLITKHLFPETVEDLSPFAHLTPISMRLEVLEGKAGTLLINDTYNSDYDSLSIALDFQKRRNNDAQPTALILAQIEDSTEEPRQLLQRVSQLINRYHLNKLYLVGADLQAYLSLFPTLTQWFPTSVELDKGLPIDTLSGYNILFKGGSNAHFDKVIENWRQQTHQTILSINLTSLAHNFQTLKAQLPPHTETISMIKANGYGAGAYEVARTLERAGTDYLAVAVADEGKELRKKGITLPIIVMNPELSNLRTIISYHLQPEIYSFELLQQYEKTAMAYSDHVLPIHLKWNTGMNRLGFAPTQVQEVAKRLGASTTLRVASIFTHLAVADDPSEDAFTLRQLETLDQIHRELSTALNYTPKKHALNTAGAIRFPRYQSDIIRLGIGLYGISPLSKDQLGLEPIATLTTQILQIQDLRQGDTIGYGRRGKADRPSRIAIIPIGYADGLPRLLGNGHITFQLPDGSLVPTIGNICMDTLMLDVTDAPSATTGTEVTIFSDKLPITRLSDVCQTIPYETLSRLSSRIARHYFTE